MTVGMAGIGELNEKPLHAALKRWYARPGDRLEVTVDGFVIDIVRGDLLIEIQTGHFASIKAKLTQLLRAHPVRVIYPLVEEKWIVRPGVRRKSPKRGRVHDVFWELVRVPHVLANPNFSLELVTIRAEEAWRYVGKRQWRRRGWAVEERRLLEVLGQRVFAKPSDWRALVPGGLESFTASDLATALNASRKLTQRMAYCLQRSSMIELAGKRGRAKLYSVPCPPASV